MKNTFKGSMLGLVSVVIISVGMLSACSEEKSTSSSAKPTPYNSSIESSTLPKLSHPDGTWKWFDQDESSIKNTVQKSGMFDKVYVFPNYIDDKPAKTLSIQADWYIKDTAELNTPQAWENLHMNAGVLYIWLKENKEMGKFIIGIYDNNGQYNYGSIMFNLEDGKEEISLKSPSFTDNDGESIKAYCNFMMNSFWKKYMDQKSQEKCNSI